MLPINAEQDEDRPDRIGLCRRALLVVGDHLLLVGGENAAGYVTQVESAPLR